MSTRAYVIAEAGVNHNGDIGLALKLVEKAADAGADAVKFQTFDPEAIASAGAPLAAYQKRGGAQAGDQRTMLKRLALDEAAHRELLARCRDRSIDFLSTPFDLPSLRFLTAELDLKRIKIGSGDATNALLLYETARTGAEVILSTGMTTLDEIEQALGVLAFGYLDSGDSPSRAAFDAARTAPAGESVLREKVTMLQCTTAYPAPIAEVNLRAMDTLAQRFGLPVGLSDHSAGISVALAAAARGAKIIEKHFTLDRRLPGPDQRASLEPDELSEMIDGIREVESALGSGAKQPMESEKENIAAARKSLVAARGIRKGEKFDQANLTVKRPGDGVSALEYWDWLGRESARDYAADEVIRP